MTDAVRRALEFAAEHMHSDWPERCQEIVRRARAALSEQPAPRVCKGIPRVGCNYLAECDSVCNKCGKVHAVHLIPGVGSTAPVERVQLSESVILALLSEHTTFDLQHGEEPPLVEDNYGARRYAGRFIDFARAVIAEYERLNGISATPRQPLSEAQIAAVLRKASERAGFVTLEAGEPSAFMVGVVRDVEAAHGITPAQGKGGE